MEPDDPKETKKSAELRRMIAEARLRRPFTDEEKALQAKLDAELAAHRQALGL